MYVYVHACALARVRARLCVRACVRVCVCQPLNRYNLTWSRLFRGRLEIGKKRYSQWDK